MITNLFKLILFGGNSEMPEGKTQTKTKTNFYLPQKYCTESQPWELHGSLCLVCAYVTTLKQVVFFTGSVVAIQI